MWQCMLQAMPSQALRGQPTLPGRALGLELQLQLPARLFVFGGTVCLLVCKLGGGCGGALTVVLERGYWGERAGEGGGGEGGV